MAIEFACRQFMPRPWGVADPGDWGVPTGGGVAIGEIWYDRPGDPATKPALLLKVLLTSQPLSIQVHPNDDFAKSIGLANGKTEAWHVLSAAPGARVAVGLKHHLTAQQLHSAAMDGSIADEVSWRTVAAEDTILVPAGTIHAIGAGLVIAEIQQRSDTTFRLFDHGRARALHIERAVAAAIPGPSASQPQPNRMSAERTLLVSGSHFVLERMELPPGTTWRLAARRETWLLVLGGSATAGKFEIAKGDAVFAQADDISIRVGGDGLVALVAYTGIGPAPGILRRSAAPAAYANGSADDSRGARPNARQITELASRRSRSPLSPIQRVAFVGNHLPRRCGIATFTHDLHQAVAIARPGLKTTVVAMNDAGRTYDYPPCVEFEIPEETSDGYARAAGALNRGRFDVVSLQHEYGIFGGAAGGNIVALMKRLEMPIVTTLHTVLAEPTVEQRAVMGQIIAHSAKLVVMADKGRKLLQSVHGVPAAKIEVIPHGIPDVPFLGTGDAKRKLGFSGRMVILTFGLLSPSKGIETVIDAMPRIIEACPTAVYVVLGATHPNLVRHHGEAYRESLVQRVTDLGVEDHVVFVDQFVDQATLLDFISMCDVYVTPYLNEAQMTSGTLAYSFGLGKAVVSTPYWHASELLGDGRGVLVPFGDATHVGHEIALLLTDDTRRNGLRERAYAESRSMTWAQTASTYLSTFENATQTGRHDPASPAAIRPPALPATLAVPNLQIGHLLSMCDGTGLLQHAVHGIPDRSHGYCVDDNARALLLATTLGGPGAPRLPSALTTRFAAFIQHAWNPDTRRFRNFMSYDRRWLEDQGSEDSHARTLWALGECARSDQDRSRRQWAARLFMTALPSVEDFRSPRAWAFTLLGLNAYCAVAGDDAAGVRMRGMLAEKLLSALTAVETNDWIWFEESLAYDNARLPQALIVTGLATGNQTLIDAGLRSLRWLMAIQQGHGGCFRPVGTQSFGKMRRLPMAFDQQPVEAAAAISACLAAWIACRNADWLAGATLAFEWFLGRNDLAAPLAEPDTGSCLDGLHEDRPNENRGAESVLSYLLGLAEMRRCTSSLLIEHKPLAFNLVRGDQHRATVPGAIPGGHVVAIPVLEPPDFASAAGSGAGRGQTLQASD